MRIFSKPKLSKDGSPSCFDDTMKLVGDFWTLRIIDALSDRELRFCEIERGVSDISPATLTNRLKKLEDNHLIQRLVETRDKQSVTYILTDKGQGVLPILQAIRRFTDSQA
jgi:DNA-binding HxlR family transcriptional regulator